MYGIPWLLSSNIVNLYSVQQLAAIMFTFAVQNDVTLFDLKYQKLVIVLWKSISIMKQIWA